MARGYAVACAGHSLGAGAAVLLAVLIRGRYPTLAVPLDGAPASTSTRGRQRVRVYAFAPPPVLDRASALACRGYVTSVVNNADLIPRSSLTNLDAFLTVLEAVRLRLAEKGMNPGGAGRRGSSALAAAGALLGKLSEGTRGELLLAPAALRRVAEEAAAEAARGDGECDGLFWDEECGHHLFVPGRVLVMHEAWRDAAREERAVALEEEKRREGCRPEEGASRPDCGDLHGMQQALKARAMWTDGVDAVLKTFEIGAGSGMVMDHLTCSYERGLALLEQTCIDDCDTVVRFP